MLGVGGSPGPPPPMWSPPTCRGGRDLMSGWRERTSPSPTPAQGSEQFWEDTTLGCPLSPVDGGAGGRAQFHLRCRLGRVVTV